MSTVRILAVDDHRENRELLEAALTDRGYEVLLASDGTEALFLAEREAPRAILLDVMMPRLDGIEVCRRLKGRRPTCFIPVVILTALADRESKVLALEAGADDFLTKPFRIAELVTRLETLLRIRRLRDELDSSESVLFSMVELLEGKSEHHAHHSLRVARLVAAAVPELALPSRDVADLILGAALHDLGKLSVPEPWLETPESELGEEARARLRQHVDIGPRILQPIASLAGVLPYLRHHHERLDGSGYPDGLAGDQFPPALELLALANAWDRARLAATSGGPPPAEALRAEVAAGRFRPATLELVLRFSEAAERPVGLAELLPVPAPLSGGHVLVADDSATNRQLYEDLLTREGYRTTVVASGAAVLAMWRQLRPDLVLLDVRMPGLSGSDVARSIKQEPEGGFLPVLLVTAYEELGLRERALAAGADDLLFAPVHQLELLARIRSLLRLKLYHEDLADHESVVLSLSEALEAKDPWTRGHSQRVGQFAAAMAGWLQRDPAEQKRYLLAGLLHDLGKIGVPESILHKPGKLTAEEWAAVASHPEIGYKICRRLRSAERVLDAIRFHHERLDGSGYPLGLRGLEIPYDARLLAVADAFEALTSDRPYRARLSPEEAIGVLREEADHGKWDRELLAALEAVLAAGEVPAPRPDRSPRG